MKDPIDPYDPTRVAEAMGPRLSPALVDQRMPDKTVQQPPRRGGGGVSVNIPLSDFNHQDLAGLARLKYLHFRVTE